MHIIREKFHLNDVDVECKFLFYKIISIELRFNCGEAVAAEHVTYQLQKGYF